MKNELKFNKEELKTGAICGLVLLLVSATLAVREVGQNNTILEADKKELQVEVSNIEKSVTGYQFMLEKLNPEATFEWKEVKD